MSKKASKGLTMSQFVSEVRRMYLACAEKEVRRRNSEDDPFEDEDGSTRPWTVKDLEQETWPEDAFEKVFNRLENETSVEGNDGRAAACLLLLATLGRL